VKKDYVKQLEAANEELQRKLLEQGRVITCLEEAYDHSKEQMKSNRLVIVCSDEQDAINSGIGRGKLGDMIYTADLMVIPVTPEEKQTVFMKYQITLAVKLSLFKSIKDRSNKQGSIYDTDLLRKYARGELVNPYEI
jgi:hypothetical protein